MSTYVWCEDSKSGFDFWKEIFGEINSDYIVETKNNNSQLRAAAESINDDGNIYYILIDQAIDNPEVLREIQRIRKKTRNKANVRFIPVNSFEYTLLSFELLEQWVFQPTDPLRVKRQSLFLLRDKFINLWEYGGSAAELLELKNDLNYPKDYPEIITSEQLSARLLSDITNNTGFSTGKGKFGRCFVNTCCDRESDNDKRCGLDTQRLSSSMKKKLLIERSVLKKALEEVGLQ